MLQARKKYRIQYGDKIGYANVIDYDRESAILTADGTAMFIWHPDKLTITSTADLKSEPDSPQERAALGGIALK